MNIIHCFTYVPFLLLKLQLFFAIVQRITVLVGVLDVHHVQEDVRASQMVTIRIYIENGVHTTSFVTKKELLILGNVQETFFRKPYSIPSRRNV